ncbi:MAG: TolC family protein [Acidobacteriota bacterium]
MSHLPLVARPRARRRRAVPIARCVPIGLLACFIFLGAAAASAQEVRPAPPPALTLDQALDLTLGTAPEPALAREAARRAAGREQSAAGIFDLGLALTTSFEHAEGALTRGALQREFDRREIRRILIADFTAIADDLDAQLADIDARPRPDCRGFARLVIDGVDICLSERDTSLAATYEELVEIALREAADDPVRQEELRELRDAQLLILRDTLARTSDVLRQNALANQQALDLLGVIPEDEVRETFAFDLRARRLLRNGMDLGFGVVLEGVEDNFDGKDLLASLGGKGLPNAFLGFIGLTLDAPLGEGFGVDSATAPARAAELDARAAGFEVGHRAAGALRSTLSSYWRTAAAVERLELLRRAEALETRLLEIVDGLIEGDVVPGALRPRIEGRLASARSDIASAELELRRARFALAAALGTDAAQEANAPRVAATLAEVPEAARLARLDVPSLVELALARRGDLEAARLRTEASSVLARAAERDLRRRVDLSVSIGYSGLYETFDDEIYDLEAFWEAFSGDLVGPSATVTLTTELPRGNRVSRARLDQSQSLARRSEIATRDLRRSIELRVASLVGSLAETAAEAERLRTSVVAYGESLEAAQARFEAGEATIADTVLTEELATFAALRQVDVRQRWQALLAELYFTTGMLVEPGRVTEVPQREPFAVDRLTALIDAAGSVSTGSHEAQPVLAAARVARGTR